MSVQFPRTNTVCYKFGFYLTDALIVVDAKKEVSAINEAMRMGIPVVALIDTNTDPLGVTHIIPGNDDSPKAISFIMQHIENYVKEGVAAFEASRPARPAPRASVTPAPKAVVAAPATEAAVTEEPAAPVEKKAARPAARKTVKKDE